jgi:hypothetical protein
MLLTFVIPAAADIVTVVDGWTITSRASRRRGSMGTARSRSRGGGAFGPEVKAVNHPVTWIALFVVLAVVAVLLWWTVRFPSTSTWRGDPSRDPIGNLPLKTQMVIGFGIFILTPHGIRDRAAAGVALIAAHDFTGDPHESRDPCSSGRPLLGAANDNA